MRRLQRTLKKLFHRFRNFILTGNHGYLFAFGVAKNFVVLLLVSPAVHTACSPTAQNEEQRPASTEIGIFSSISSQLPVTYHSMSGHYLGRIYFSEDLKTVALPVYFAIPDSSSSPIHCFYFAVGHYRLDRISATETRFQMIKPRVYLRESESYEAQHSNQAACLAVDTQMLAKRYLQYPDEIDPTLRTDLVTRFDEQMVVFGSHEQSPLKYSENVFVRQNQEVEVTTEIMQWFYGRYLEPDGEIALDRNAMMLEVNIPANFRLDAKSDVVKRGVVPANSLCHLRFRSKLRKMTYRSVGGASYYGSYLWLDFEAIPSDQRRCLLQRIPPQERLISNGLIGIRFDFVQKDTLQISFNDLRWIGRKR